MPESGRLVNVQVSFRNIDSSDALKSYAAEKLQSCLKKFVHHDTEVHLNCRVEKTRHIAEVSFRTDGADFVCKEDGDDLYSAVDKLIDALTSQLRRHKEKLTDHHKGAPRK